MSAHPQLELGVGVEPAPEPAPVKPWIHRGEFRKWARAESEAAIALQQAYETRDPSLIEGARRTHREVVGRMPACALPRRRRG